MLRSQYCNAIAHSTTQCHSGLESSLLCTIFMTYTRPPCSSVASSVIGWLPWYCTARVQVTLILHNKAPKVQEQSGWHLVYAKRSCNVLPFCEKVKVFRLIRKGKLLYPGVARIYAKNKSSACEIVMKEEEIHSTFVIAFQLQKLLP